tara:strand:+ start:955 stop:1245 length:291 start_codon:yes stop_codon:yes gene_type:complete
MWSEKQIEKYFHEQIELIGGTTRKWVSPGRAGVPDRIVFYAGHVVFVELKTTKGKLSSVQAREHVRLTELGASVVTLYGDAMVNEFVHYDLVKLKC